MIAVIGGVVGYRMWNKPHREVESEKGIEITAVELVKEYAGNEGTANAKYLDKTIQVTGEVTEIKTNQEGNTTVTLKSDDPFAGVFCTLKEKSVDIASGANVTIKGICSGMLSDVRLREAVVVKK